MSPSLTSAASTLSTSVSPTHVPSVAPAIVLATSVTPAFAVLGVILILTGIPSAFLGHKNRWTSFFLTGFYTLALVCIVLILKFGVLPAINPPSQTLCGLFVLSATVAGVAGGAISIFFWRAARYGIGAWGGFAVALWIQSLHNGGLIRSIAFRWVLYIGCGLLGFTLCTIPKIHYHIVLISTAFVGASSFILGIDCFTTAGLKEFYIWNIGFSSLFPKFINNGMQYPVSQTMQIELGLIAAVALMGITFQFRLLGVLQKKLREIEELEQRDGEAEVQAAERFSHIAQERDAWEKDHPSSLSNYSRPESSTFSSMLLLKDREDSSSSVLDNPSPRHPSGISDFKLARTSDEDIKRPSRAAQALPAWKLGQAIEEDVPSVFMAKPQSAELEDIRRKEELLAEIRSVRHSIDVLRSEVPGPSSSEPSRRPSLASRRTLSIGAGSTLHPTSDSHPPWAIDPALSHDTSGDSIIRPTSVPLKEFDWDNYILARRIIQPPAGVTLPIGTTPSLGAPRMRLSPAVQDALNHRKRRESALGPSTDSFEDPVIAPISQVPRGTHTSKESTERHREKMRDVQAPLTQAEKEHAELEAIKQRWERSKTLEKETVTRRPSEKAAALEKRKKSNSSPVEHDERQPSLNEHHRSSRHIRSVSADKLTSIGASSRRLSTVRADDWRGYQQLDDTEMDVKTDHTLASGSGSKRDPRRMNISI